MNVIDEFSVDQRFIDEGKCDSPTACAVALAAQFYLDCDVKVEATWMMVDGVVYRMTRFLRDWVRDFDLKLGVQPIRVILYEENNILMADQAWIEEEEE